MARSFLTSLLAALVLAGLVHACTSSAGHTCRMPSDCDTGLLCCDSGAVVSGGNRGVCQSACTIVVVDAGQDSGQDAGADAGTDSGTDAGTDSGSDAGTDASADAAVD